MTTATPIRLIDAIRGRGLLGPYIRTVMVFSIVASLMLLVSPLYMLQIYDRVLTSGSIETLILISGIAGLLLVVYVVAELARRRAAALAAKALESAYDERVFLDVLASEDANALRTSQTHLTTLQTFLSQGMILPLFDLPFTPLFLALMFLIHPVIGWLGLIGAIILLAIAVYSEMSTRSSVEEAQGAESEATNYAASLEQQRSAVLSMGMGHAAYAEWASRKDDASAGTLSNATDNGNFTAITRGLRMALQIAALGAGATLVLAQQTTPGAIIAGSILLGRALAPIDQSVGIWRQIVRGRVAWRELGGLLQADETSQEITALPRPKADLKIENLEIGVPGSERPLVPKFSLALGEGSVTTLAGNIGSGKTTMLQTLSGAWPKLAGQVRLNGADIHKWDSNDRGQYVGYAPQTGELVPGTVAQNIARFSEAEPDEVFAAAELVGAHQTISSLVMGYDTPVGPGGVHLSAGQITLIALARAFFRNPVLILLDEPSANLDRENRGKLLNLIESHRTNGSIVIMATHDPAFIEMSDRVVLLSAQQVGAAKPSEYLASQSATANEAASVTAQTIRLAGGRG